MDVCFCGQTNFLILILHLNLFDSLSFTIREKEKEIEYSYSKLKVYVIIIIRTIRWWSFNKKILCAPVCLHFGLLYPISDLLNRWVFFFENEQKCLLPIGRRWLMHNGIKAKLCNFPDIFFFVRNKTNISNWLWKIIYFS